MPVGPSDFAYSIIIRPHLIPPGLYWRQNTTYPKTVMRLCYINFLCFFFFFLAFPCRGDGGGPAVDSTGRMPEVVCAIVGRVRRQPPSYLELGLRTAISRIQADPDVLSEYDEAARCCEKLGRFDEALDWHEKKRGRMDQLEAKGGRYEYFRHSYLSHTAVLHFRRWLRDGADRTKLQEVEEARRLLRRASEQSPEWSKIYSDFYVSRFIEWVAAQSPVASGDSRSLPAFLDFSTGGDDADAAIRAMTTLIHRDVFWENIDIFNTLILALDADDKHVALAQLARWRCLELAKQGKTSLVPGTPEGAKLAERIARPGTSPRDEGKLRDLYSQLRDEAEAWQRHYSGFLADSAARGDYPDWTERGSSWSAYSEKLPPDYLFHAAAEVEFGRSAPDVRRPNSLSWLDMTGMVGAILAGFVYLLRKNLKRLLLTYKNR